MHNATGYTIFSTPREGMYAVSSTCIQVKFEELLLIAHMQP